MSALSAYASTNGLEYIEGTLRLLKSYQLPPGFFLPNAKIQQSPRTSMLATNLTGLIGYSFNLVSAAAGYYEQTGDIEFAKEWTPSVSSFLDWVASQTDSRGLFNISDSSFGGDWNYYDPPQTGAITKFNSLWAYTLKNVLPLLSGAGQPVLVQKYQQQYTNLKTSITTNLWNTALDAYSLSDTVLNVIAQDANALAVLADINPPQNSVLLKTLGEHLFIPNGALAFSNSSIPLGFQAKMSPYSSGYHLYAAFYANDSSTVEHLLYTLWGNMVDPLNVNATGTVWETLNPDGSPGLGISTSLCHAWGSAPTGALSKYVLGIRPVQPGFSQWIVAPQTLNLEWASGKYPTPLGIISVSWKYVEDLFEMNVTSPDNAHGVIHLPYNLRIELDANAIEVVVNGKQVDAVFPVQVSSASVVQIRQISAQSSSSQSSSSQSSSSQSSSQSSLLPVPLHPLQLLFLVFLPYTSWFLWW